MNELVAINTDDSLEHISKMKFEVIKKKEMNEINSFISGEHQKMLTNFSKSQSNFMDTMLVFNAPTDIRNIRQISAEIEKKKLALSESHFKLRKKEIKLKKKQRKLDNTTDDLDRELLQVQIEEIIHVKNQIMTYVEASLKSILNMKQQYESILKNKGISDVTELDFELEEEEYHIKKSCIQAFEDIVATGRVSIGNNKYLLQVGIMPNIIHNIWIKFLASDSSSSKDSFYDIIDQVYNRYKGCSAIEAERKGITNIFHKNSVFKIEQ